MILSGIATALIFLPAVGGALSGVEPGHAGTASGLFQTMQQLGGAMGLAVIASVYAANAIPGQFVPGVRQAFIAAAALAALTGLSALTLAVRRRRLALQAEAGEEWPVPGQTTAPSSGGRTGPSWWPPTYCRPSRR